VKILSSQMGRGTAKAEPGPNEIENPAEVCRQPVHRVNWKRPVAPESRRQILPTLVGRSALSQ